MGSRERPRAASLHVVNEGGRRLAEQRGHELVRYFWRMEIDLPASLLWPSRRRESPSGSTARRGRRGPPCDATGSLPVHWDFTPSPLEDWVTWRQERGEYDLALWRIAEENCEIGAPHSASARTVRLGARSRGQAGFTAGRSGALLLQSGFAALWRDGHTRVGSRSTRRTTRARQGSTKRRHEGHAPLCDLREGARIAGYAVRRGP